MTYAVTQLAEAIAKHTGQSLQLATDAACTILGEVPGAYRQAEHGVAVDVYNGVRRRKGKGISRKVESFRPSRHLPSIITGTIALLARLDNPSRRRDPIQLVNGKMRERPYSDVDSAAAYIANLAELAY